MRHITPPVIAIVAVLAVATAAPAAGDRAPAFDVVPLGVEGGLEEGATTAWYIAPVGGGAGIACDAGTLVPGIRKAIRRGAFGGRASVSSILHRQIAAYLVTHPHLDHVAGLVMASPDDTPKPILALAETNGALAADYFNWRAWPNMGDRGRPPLLRRYRYRDLIPAAAPTGIDGTALRVSAFPLSHGGTVSTAFLIHSGEDAILCMGDTGPDAVERSDTLARVWTAIAPLVRTRRLRAILVETSYPDPRADAALYGHLTPRWLRTELARLATATGDDAALRGLPIVIGHIKPAIDRRPDPANQIMRQLATPGGPPVRFVQARQGIRLRF